MIRRITFASCYVYSPCGSSAVSERSRLLRALLKEGDTHFMNRYAVRVRQQVADNPLLAGYLGPRQVLVPIPGSKRSDAGAVPVARQLALALVQEGLGIGIWEGLLRVRAVRKSATAARGSRPTVGTHYDSFAIEPAAAPPDEVMLIDDVITKGRTLLAAAARLQDACPTARIRAFALLRTLGLGQGMQQLLEPCIGEISWRGGDARREP